VRRWLPLTALLLFPLVPFSQRRIDARLGVHRAQEEVLYFWSGEQVRRLFPGFEGVAADVYWLRTVQYFGRERAFGQKRFELLLPLVEITTSLDPQLEIAYRYGAIFLCAAPPEGAGRPRDGVALLQRGAGRLPRSWTIWQNLGFFHFIYLKDPQRAAEVLMQAAEIPGAAFWLRSLAADLLAKGGDRAASRRMWRQMLDSSEEGVLRTNAAYNLKVLESLDLADALTAAVAEFERRRGRRPRTLDELRETGAWSGRLDDLAGVPFSYDEASGRVSISRRSEMNRPL
jgi:hypothetical protein